MFDSTKFKELLQTQWLGAEFIHLEETESTNTALKKLPSDQLSHGMVLLADSQVKGRGQHDKPWLAEPGKNLTFTIALKPSEADRLHLLTVAAAWSVNQVLREIRPAEFRIKWPNDLIAGGKKIGGILTETVFNGQLLDRVLVGIGINVEQTEFPVSIQGEATSLSLLSEKKVDKEKLLAAILLKLEHAYRQWLKREKELVKSINREMIGHGEKVRITVQGKPFGEKVKFLGINEKGEFVILTKNLEIKAFSHEQIRIHVDS